MAFYEWATANGYRKGLNLDREKNDKGYSPKNCRFVTPQQNSCNKRKKPGTSSKYRGVCWERRKGKWLARYSRNSKSYYLGYFTSERNAAKAWDKEAAARGRDDYVLNFPREARNPTKTRR